MPYDSAYWTAPRKPHWLTGWFERHRPVGSTFSGSGYGSGPSYIVYGVMFDFPDKREVPIREVTVSLAAAKGGGSAIRANGLAVWQRPKPPIPLLERSTAKNSQPLTVRHHLYEKQGRVGCSRG